MSDEALYQIAQRLDRLETKTDNMVKALIEIARTEERVVRLMENDAQKTQWLKELQTQMNLLQTQNAQRTTIEKWVERGVWAALSAGVATFIAWLTHR